MKSTSCFSELQFAMLDMNIHPGIVDSTVFLLPTPFYQNASVKLPLVVQMKLCKAYNTNVTVRYDFIMEHRHLPTNMCYMHSTNQSVHLFSSHEKCKNEYDKK